MRFPGIMLVVAGVVVIGLLVAFYVMGGQAQPKRTEVHVAVSDTFAR